MSSPICEDCKWNGNTTYCRWCTTSLKAVYPGFEPLKNKDHQRLDTFLEVKT